MDISQARAAVAQADGMDTAQANAFLDLLMTGSLSPEEGGSLLRALSERGETATELAAVVRGLLARARMLPNPVAAADCCGTGGSGRTRFNVSTTAAVVVAACGIPMAKHGNKGSRRPNGSFDLLEALGVPLHLSPEAQSQLLRDHCLTFCFARAHHPAVAAVVPYRQAAGGRTIFNLAGPLANPAAVDCQVVGVCDAATAQVVAEALHLLGRQRAVVVTGEPGWDEFVLDGRNHLLTVGADGVEARCLPAPWPQSSPFQLPGGDAEDNVEVFSELLSGRHSGPLLELVCFAAGAVIDTWYGRPVDFHGEGSAQAREALQSGQAKLRFDAYLAAAQALS
ncbi:MAG: anthranilate phosphoribosyltransferase [Planctomycetota bacterium]|nr:MAG: anthranilate phosphoribosyltransferase [Planctomycetota bacterium]